MENSQEELGDDMRKGLRFGEYLRWYKKNGIYEETLAPKVIEKICRIHDIPLDSIRIYPRFMLDTGRGKIEFDMILKYVDGRGKERLVGIEFKIADFKKVVEQALVRREFVDYMYVATHTGIWFSGQFDAFFLMLYFGIGWILIGEKEVFLVMKARWNSRTTDKLLNVLQSLIIQKFKNELKNIKSLQEWLENS